MTSSQSFGVGNNPHNSAVVKSHYIVISFKFMCLIFFCKIMRKKDKKTESKIQEYDDEADAPFIKFLILAVVAPTSVSR
jgi:hypothetical protein